MTYNDSSEIQHNTIKLSLWNLFEFFRKYSSFKMDKTGHATILRNAWFCIQYTQDSKQGRLQLSLHNIKSQTEKLMSLPNLSYMLLVVIIITYSNFKINTHSWKLSVDKHATAYYTYKKLQITQATMKWSLQTKVQHKTAAHTNVTLM